MKKYVRKISAVVTAIMVVIVALLGTRVEARAAEEPSLAGTEWVLYQCEFGVEETFNIGDDIGGGVLLSEDMCTAKFFDEENIRFSCSLAGYEPTNGKFVSYGNNKYALWAVEPFGTYDEAEVQCAIDGDYIKATLYPHEVKFTLRKTNAPTPTPTPAPKKASAPAHVHSFTWQTITEPTKDSDGLEGEVCSCGATRNTQPLSAFGFILNDYAPSLIKAAKPGQTVTFEFGERNSFPKEFMAKLVDKSAQNVTFVFHYNWNHVKQEITIPAGTPIDLNFDWYGPAKMAELYGAN